MASVLCYISRRSKESYKPSSHADPATVYDEVGTNKKMKGDVMEMNTNTAYGLLSAIVVTLNRHHKYLYLCV